jgi:hypothetical protein
VPAKIRTGPNEDPSCTSASSDKAEVRIGKVCFQGISGRASGDRSSPGVAKWRNLTVLDQPL